jgi:hypothetical protein
MASSLDQGPDDPLKGQLYSQAHQTVQERIAQPVKRFDGPSHHGSGVASPSKAAQALQSTADLVLADRVWFIENHDVASDGICFDVTDPTTRFP